jgi:hypothetical protein
MNYKIISDEAKLDSFIEFLPETNKEEVYYICLFGRHKYCESIPITKVSEQLNRIIARKEDIKEKIRRLETPIGSYVRDGVVIPQNALALYITFELRVL